MTEENLEKNTESSAETQMTERLEQLETELAHAKAKADENWDKALRAGAELENVKRRASLDVANAHKYSIERFAQSLLPVIDSLEQAMALTLNTEAEPSRSHIQAMLAGIELTRKLFLDSMEKFGLTQIDPKGEVFNPESHEAMSMIPQEGAESNVVLQVFQRGYVLNGRVIRPARVIISQ